MTNSRIFPREDNMKEIIDVKMIEEYLEKNHFTKTEFCKRCGISMATLNRILLNQNINVLSLFRVAKEMNVPLHKMFRSI